jgi:hypothetical protein
MVILTIGKPQEKEVVKDVEPRETERPTRRK